MVWSVRRGLETRLDGLLQVFCNDSGTPVLLLRWSAFAVLSCKPQLIVKTQSKSVVIEGEVYVACGTCERIRTHDMIVHMSNPVNNLLSLHTFV